VSPAKDTDVSRFPVRSSVDKRDAPTSDTDVNLLSVALTYVRLDSPFKTRDVSAEFWTLNEDNLPKSVRFRAVNLLLL
jgi:hypothetical protein